MPLSPIGEAIFQVVFQPIFETVYYMIVEPLFRCTGCVLIYIFSFAKWLPTENIEQDELIKMQKWRPYLRIDGRTLVSKSASVWLGFLFYATLLGIWIYFKIKA